jgi:hypothetical protein
MEYIRHFSSDFIFSFLFVFLCYSFRSCISLSGSPVLSLGEEGPYQMARKMKAKEQLRGESRGEKKEKSYS